MIPLFCWRVLCEPKSNAVWGKTGRENLGNILEIFRYGLSCSIFNSSLVYVRSTYEFRRSFASWLEMSSRFIQVYHESFIEIPCFALKLIVLAIVFEDVVRFSNEVPVSFSLTAFFLDFPESVNSFRFMVTGKKVISFPGMRHLFTDMKVPSYHYTFLPLLLLSNRFVWNRQDVMWLTRRSEDQRM